MSKVLIAGATGYLGRYLVKELKKQGHWVRALARNPKKLEDLKDHIDEIVEAELTNPESLCGICDGIDILISSIGITRQKDGFNYIGGSGSNLNNTLFVRELGLELQYTLYREYIITVEFKNKCFNYNTQMKGFGVAPTIYNLKRVIFSHGI